MRRQGVTQQLSPQQLLDCTPNTKGCNGGWPPYAIDSVKKNGITSERIYPYVGYQQTCRYNPSQKVGGVRAYQTLTLNGNEAQLK